MDGSVSAVGLPAGSSKLGEGLTGEDYAFLVGLGLFIFFLFLAHPSTLTLGHQVVIFWISITLLFLSMAPDYVNRKTARGWMEDYRRTRLAGFYSKIYSVARNGDRYFNPQNFVISGIILTVITVVITLRGVVGTGVQEFLFGIALALYVRGILGE